MHAFLARGSVLSNRRSAYNSPGDGTDITECINPNVFISIDRYRFVQEDCSCLWLGLLPVISAGSRFKGTKA